MRWKTSNIDCIYRSPTGIHVYQDAHYRWLTLNSDIMQTRLNRHYPERPALQYIKPLIQVVCQQPAVCCLLGLGGAGVAHALQPYLGSYELIAVESSEEVIAVANTHFMLDRLNNVQIIHNDASIYIHQCNESFKHILIDLFDAYSFPAHCNNQLFFNRCQQLLIDGGVLAVNMASMQEHWPIVKYIRNSFNACTVSIPVAGTANIIVLAINSLSISPLLELIQKNRDLQQLSWDSQWGCIAQL